MYNISVLPRANIQYRDSMTNITLRLSYNVHYNVNIAALCGENSSPILNIEFNYGKSSLSLIIIVTTSSLEWKLFFDTKNHMQLNVMIHSAY